MEYKPYKYQQFGERHIIKNLAAALFWDMGLGKTVITASALRFLIKEALEINRVLIIAPLRVAKYVWPAELSKWDHLKDLKYSLVIGSERQRIKALNTKADIYIIGKENVSWIVAFYMRRWPFDCIVVDELSAFKSHNANRFVDLSSVRPLSSRIIGLTGTPAPNSLIDLWSQVYLLDMGKRLGPTITGYRKGFFSEGSKNGHVVYNWVIKDEESKKQIYKRIGDICISMKAKDYLDLPEQINRIIPVSLTDNLQRKYDEFERESVLELMDMEIVHELMGENNIIALNRAALVGKLLQFASGAIYDENKEVHKIHYIKIQALAEIVDELNGNPLLVFYWYKHSLDRLLKKFKKYKPSLLKTQKELDDWNKGKITLAFVHPASAGHGLNLQFGGHNNVWFDNTYSLELLLQANARLLRPGQKYTVISNRLVMKGTMDEEVIEAQDRKEKGQTALINALATKLIDKYR